MPTPFSHLVAAQSILDDPAVAPDVRRLINDHAAAFLLGSVVADGHFLGKLRRDETHFYSYDRPITLTLWRVMFEKYPSLWHAADEDQRAFLAGYVFHLTMDEVWTMDMLHVYFAQGEWGTREQRFLMLHVLLIDMDERDQALLDDRSFAAMLDVQPGEWLTFMSASVLRQWADLMYRQIKPAGRSETLDIIAPRVGMTPAELRAVLDDHARAERELWAHIPRAALAQIESRMRDRARAEMLTYLQQTKENA